MTVNSLCQDDTVEGFELSPQQRRLLQTKVNGECMPSIARATLRLPAEVDLACLRDSFETMLSHHEILRTSFQRLPAMALPVQVIHPFTPVNWQENTRANNFQITLHQENDGAWELTLTLSAAQCDSESVMQLLVTWAAMYQSMAHQGRLHRSDLIGDGALQYADYAMWRQDLMSSDSQAQAFWETRLNAMHPASTLPFYRNVDAESPISSRKQSHVDLPFSLQQQWMAMANQYAVSLPIISLAVWLTLLHQHSEDDQVSLWVEWQARNPELAGSLGLFCDALPMTMKTAEETTFSELCHALHQECADLKAWSDYFPSSHPKAMIDQQLSMAGFRFIEAPCDEVLSRNGWQLISVTADTLPTALFLECQQQGQRLTLMVDYDASKFSEAAVDLIKDQFLSLLQHACHHPTARLRDLSALSEATQHWLEKKISHCPAITSMQKDSYYQAASLPHLAECFYQQCKLTPDAPAVKGVSGALSYHALDMQALALAHRLHAQGAHRGMRIGHFLTRDIDAIVAMLAIFKVGAVYVPVDPDYPAQRIDYIFSDSKTELVITRTALMLQLPLHWQAPERLVFTDSSFTDSPFTDTPDTSPSQALSVEVNHDDIAYLIYTSGSTGEPKGVVITHGNALHSLAARIAYYPVPVRHFLLLSSFAFDSSIAGLFWTLAQGGCLHVTTEIQQRDPSQLATIIKEEGITHLLALPSLYQLLLAALEPAACALTTAIVAGEVCRRSLVKQHYRELPGVQLYNEYGPTEASVWSTVAACHPQASTVGIGYPIPYSRIYLLNAHMQPIAPGMKGEVYIGGPGISPGYLNHPTLTAEKFIVHKGERLYRSGDFACIDEHGALSFLGRADAQIKMRGFRIELGEIETALQRLTNARQVVVIIASDAIEGDRLRAFIEADESYDAVDLSQRLQAQLPQYMVPSDIQVLPHFPLTANGKIDKKALSALKVKHARPAFRAPHSTTEKALADIWHSLLKVDAIGMDDDFFALGGHSLLVVKLTYRIKAHFQIDIAVSQVFQHPTLIPLANLIDSASASSCLVLLKPGIRQYPPLFCLHESSGEIHKYDAMVKALPNEQTVYGLALRKHDIKEKLTLVQLAEVYCNEIQTLQPEGPYYLCGWSIGGIFALEMAHQLEAKGHNVGFLGLFDSTSDTNDEPLAFEQLIHLFRQDLTQEGQHRLNSLPARELEALQNSTQNKGKLEQLITLYAWSNTQGLPFNVPIDVIDYTLDAMRNARRWLSDFQLPKVNTRLHFWWAQETIQDYPNRINTWEAYGYKCSHHAMPGEHDTLLEQAEFLISFATTLKECQTELEATLS